MAARRGEGYKYNCNTIELVSNFQKECNELWYRIDVRAWMAARGDATLQLHIHYKHIEK